ncbi:hypothetical protein NODU109028_13455 [Nocardioides dubius]|uniref:EthD domain-containing protein n=1 Tax=Nocardioides dubius TaxID=317019 RepID=A0ABN1TJY6_9ACTN
MKLIYALTSDSAGLLLSEALRESLRAAGATDVQANVPDPAFAEAMALQSFPEKVTGLLTVWGEDEAAITSAVTVAVTDALGLDALVGGWEVEERVPLTPPSVPDGERVASMANLALLRKPADLPYADWLAHWHGPHTTVAIETQDTFGYVQNRVLHAVLAPSAASEQVAAIVEELFHEAAATDLHVFYGSGGDKAELKRRLSEMMASIAVFGADRDLELVNTARYSWKLG